MESIHNVVALEVFAALIFCRFFPLLVRATVAVYNDRSSASTGLCGNIYLGVNAEMIEFIGLIF